VRRTKQSTIPYSVLGGLSQWYEMLEILILSLEIMYYEALPFGLEINWDHATHAAYK